MRASRPQHKPTQEKAAGHPRTETGSFDGRPSLERAAGLVGSALGLQAELDADGAIDRFELGSGEATESFGDAVFGDGSDLVGDGSGWLTETARARAYLGFVGPEGAIGKRGDRHDLGHRVAAAGGIVGENHGRARLADLAPFTGVEPHTDDIAAGDRDTHSSTSASADSHSAASSALSALSSR